MARTGRPPEIPGKPRVKTVGVSVTPDEHAHYMCEAKRRHMPLAEMVRKALIDFVARFED